MLSGTDKMHLDLGQFKEKTYGNTFNYRATTTRLFGDEFPHEIYVGPLGETRFANVKKTVAYIVIDEVDYGEPVIEKWHIKTEWRK